MKRAHRGLLAGRDISLVKAGIRRPPLDRAWAAMETEFGVIERRAATPGDWPEYGSLGIWSVTSYVVEAAMLAHLGDHAVALDYVRRCIRLIAVFHADPSTFQAKTGIKCKLPSHSYAELALAADICAEQLPEADITALLEVLRHRGIDSHHPLDGLLNYAGGANTPVAKSINAGVAALLWGEECGHPHWRTVVDLARDAAILYLHHGVDPDGYGYEGSVYSHETFYHIYLLAELLRVNGWCNLFEQEQVLKHIPVASATLLFPDRSALINTNDHGLLWPFAMPWLLLTARHYKRPSDLGLWYEFQGPDHPMRPFGNTMIWVRKQLPAATAMSAENYHVTPYAMAIAWWNEELVPQPLTEAGIPVTSCATGAGNANFRTSWSRDAIYVNIAGGSRSHASPGHAHADCGHFSIVAHGEYLAVDTGRYNTDEDQHNVMLIDGRCHHSSCGWHANRRTGHLRNYQSIPWLDYVMADSAHIKDCVWADRHLLFIRTGGDDAYLVTIDNVNANDNIHSFWWQLQTQACHHIVIDSPRTARLEAPGARLDMTFITPRAEDNPTSPHTLSLHTDIKEWGYSSPPTATDMEVSLMRTSPRRPRIIADLFGVNGLLMSVMVPRRTGAESLIVRELPASRMMRAEVSWPGGTDTIIAALDHGRIVLPGIRGWTQLAVIRRGTDGHVLSTWTIDGNPLEIDKSAQ